MPHRYAPRWLPMLFGALCAVWLVVAPRAAYASAGLCDSPGVTVELPGPLACVEIAVLAGVADEDVAGFCDLRGATGIAPRPALQGVDDGVIGVGPGCAPGVRAGAVIDGRDAPPPLVIDASEIDRAAPTLGGLVLPSPDAGRASFPESDAYALPRGFRRSLDHPPRPLVALAGPVVLERGASSRPQRRSIVGSAPLARRARAAVHARGRSTQGSPRFSPVLALAARLGGAHHASIRSFSFKDRK